MKDMTAIERVEVIATAMEGINKEQWEALKYFVDMEFDLIPMDAQRLYNSIGQCKWIFERNKKQLEKASGEDKNEPTTHSEEKE